MRSGEEVLKGLKKDGKVWDQKLERVQGMLLNEEMFDVGQEGIQGKGGNMRGGRDGKRMNGMSVERIKKVIGCLRDECQKGNGGKRIQIGKKKGKKRGVGIGWFEEKVVEEVVGMIVEGVYEEVFGKR